MTERTAPPLLSAQLPTSIPSCLFDPLASAAALCRCRSEAPDRAEPSHAGHVEAGRTTGDGRPVRCSESSQSPGGDHGRQPDAQARDHRREACPFGDRPGSDGRHRRRHAERFRIRGRHVRHGRLRHLRLRGDRRYQRRAAARHARGRSQDRLSQDELQRRLLRRRRTPVAQSAKGAGTTADGRPPGELGQVRRPREPGTRRSARNWPPAREISSFASSATADSPAPTWT